MSSEHRKPEVIEAEIANLEDELNKSRKFYKIKGREELKIPDNLRKHFPSTQRYYDGWTQKVAWEEDD